MRFSFPSVRPLRAMSVACLLFSLALVYSPRILAERMESPSYVIQFGNFNMTSGEKSSASYNVTDTVGQTGAGPYGQYGSSGYFVGSGFQYIYQFSAFSFILSKTHIDLGELVVGQHNTDFHTITITSSGANGYVVYAYEEHPLRLLNAANTIPNTTCDSGTCTSASAGIWTDTNVRGFGFNISGDDVPGDFLNTTYFRPFADRASAEPMQVVMSSNTPSRDRVATVTYKAGVGGTEAAGNYSTGVVYVAVPRY